LKFLKLLHYALKNRYVFSMYFLFSLLRIAQLLSNVSNKISNSDSIIFKCKNKDRNIFSKIYPTPCTDAENEPKETRVAPFPKGNRLSIVLTSRETSCFVSTARNIRKFKVNLTLSRYIEMNCGIAKLWNIIMDRSILKR